jgi:HK97 family phage portal protein
MAQPSLLKRARFALQILSGTPFREEATKRDSSIVHEAPMSSYGESPPTSAQRLPVLYHLSEAVNAATDEYADRVAAADYNLFETLSDGETEELKLHPGLGLLENPNPYWTHHELFKSIPTDMLSNGNAYQFLAGPSGGVPDEIWWMDPRNVKIVRDKKDYIAGYIYNVDNVDVPLLPAEVLHFRQPTPLDDLYGIPKLRTAAQNAQTNEAMSEYNRQFFTGDAGTPAGIVSTEAPVNDAEWEAIKREWKNRHGSGRKTGFIRGGVINYSTAGLSQKEMDFVEGIKLTMDQIYTAYRTWHLISEYDPKTAERWFLEGALWPMMRQIAETYTDQFFTFWGKPPGNPGYLRFSFEDIRPRERSLELEETRESRKALTFNEVRQLDGLEPLPGYDDILFVHAQSGAAPMTAQPATEPSAPPEPEPPSESDATQPEDAQERGERREAAGDDVGDDVGAFADKSMTHKALKAWRKVATADIKRTFTNEHIPLDFANAVRAMLAFADDRDTIKAAFEAAHDAVSFEWREIYAELKAIQATRLDFEGEFADLLTAARAGDVNRRRWALRARTLLRKYGESAYRDGLNDGGVPIASGEPLPEEDQIELSMLLQSQSQYVTELGRVLFKGDGVSDAQAGVKPELWFNKSILPIYQAARASADRNGMYLWIYNPLKDNCGTCTKANGQVHRLRDWHRSGVLPKSPTLECKGFHCGCTLQRVQVPATGRLSAIPRAKADESDGEDADMLSLPDDFPPDVADGLHQIAKHLASLEATEDGYTMRLQPVRNPEIYLALTEADVQQGLTLMSERLQLVGHELDGNDLIVRFTIE